MGFLSNLFSTNSDPADDLPSLYKKTILKLRNDLASLTARVTINENNIAYNHEYIEEVDDDLEIVENDVAILKQQVITMQEEIEHLRSQLGPTDPGPQYPTSVDINSITWSPDPYNGNSASPYGGAVTPLAHLTPYIDPDTGAIITRVGDEAAFGTTGQIVGHNYSSNAVWNADNTLIKLNSNPARILNDSDYSVAYVVNIPGESQWSNLDPYKMFGTQGVQFVSMDVRTGVRTVLRTFSNYSDINIGDGEGSQDRNDQYVCLIADRNGTKWIIVYDIINDTFNELDLGSSAGDLDSATVSPLGNYVILSWRTDGTGAEQGFQMYDIDLTNRRSLYAFTQHDDFGIDVNGEEVLVTLVADPSQWEAKNYIVMVRLRDQFVQPIFNDIDGGIWGAHISCRNTQRNGYAYVSENLASNEVAANRCFALPLDYTGNNQIEIYGSHHSNRLIGYKHEAKLCVNRDGTKMCFDSNWFNDTLESWDTAPAHILEYPQ